MSVAPFPVEVDLDVHAARSLQRRLGARFAVLAGFTAALVLASLPMLTAVFLFTRPDLFLAN